MGLYNTLDASNAIEVLERAIKAHGAPEIINSDQGCQYTSKEWLEACLPHEIKVSMDGRVRCLDNIWIEWGDSSSIPSEIPVGPGMTGQR